jgi:hypothetical protein
LENILLEVGVHLHSFVSTVMMAAASVAIPVVLLRHVWLID